MKEYDLIIIGSGSAMNIVDPMIQKNPGIKIAVIDKDEPGGICLTRGCIPSKILLYPAELVRVLEEARDLGIEAEIRRKDFKRIMERMRSLIGEEIDSIREGLSNSENIDYYHEIAEFTAPRTFKVGNETIRSQMIFLALGSRIVIPPIKGLEETGYLTSDSALKLEELPASIMIVGGGYIAAEFGHFFSAMGSKVTIVGRNPNFLPDEEPEISSLAKRVFSRHMEILTGFEVVEARRQRNDGTKDQNDQKIITAINRGERKEVRAQEIMIASGRGPLTYLLHPEKGGIKTTEKGWVAVDEYLETSQPNVWSLGDGLGRHLFKHVANYESEVVYYNAVLKQKVKADYHAIPHAVFTYPEVASVGLKEDEAVAQYGKENILIGFWAYENTAKGEAMNVKDYFVKVLVDASTQAILGAHIIGPQASVLIQEIINVMYTKEKSAYTIQEAIHIHPAMNEVVQRAFGSLMPVEHYHEHVLESWEYRNISRVF